MKQFFTRILCLFMAFQILFASTGFAMVEHLCKVKGRKTFLVSKPSKCCSARMASEKLDYKKPVFKAVKCCKSHSSVIKISTNSSQGNNIEYNFQGISWESYAEKSFIFNAWEISSVSFKIPHYYSPAPPLYGKNLLRHIQTFLI